jgi:citrate lyase subunit beta/citryl-CoA lyase
MGYIRTCTPRAGIVGDSHRDSKRTAHAQAVAAGRGVVLVEGRLIENLYGEEARLLVALADAIAEAAKLCQPQPI